MRPTMLVSAAALLVFAAPAWPRQQQQQQSQSSQPQQQSTAPQAAQNQNKTPAPPVQEESLADAARKAREQKKEGPKAAKVFTNENIPTTGGISSIGKKGEAAPSTTETGEAPSAEAAANEQQPASEAAPVSNEKKWRDRFAQLHHKLDQDQQELELMQRELGVLRTQFYDDPMKTLQQSMSREDINKKRADIDKKQQQVEEDKKAIADAEDELRKSGGDPGWASQR